MATKAPRPRVNMPTVAELLENPTIRTLADRLNRNVVVTGVRSFVDELRADLMRRGESTEWPSIRELVERAARHIVATQQPSQRAAVNATGRIWGGPWVGLPQSDVALEQVFALGREFVLDNSDTGSQPLAGDVESLVCRLTGAPAAVVVHSYAGAVWLALAAMGQGREAIISRAELGDSGFGVSIAQLAVAAGIHLREVGTTNRTTVEDYEAVANTQSAAVLTISPHGYCVVGETSAAELEQLIPLCRDRELLLIDALGTVPLVDMSLEIPWSRSSLQASLAAGANLAIVRGDGLTGGPACGILAGDAEVVQRIVALPLYAAFRLDPTRTASLAATLSMLSDGTTAESRLPLAALLATPRENLRHRAERLTIQLANADGIRLAEAIPTLSHCDGVPIVERALPSYGVALVPADGDVKALSDRLAAARPPIIGRIEDNRVVLDLRTVLPRQDASIVRALARNQSDSVHDGSEGAVTQS